MSEFSQELDVRAGIAHDDATAARTAISPATLDRPGAKTERQQPLTPDQRFEIRKLLADGLKQTEVAARLGVTRGAVTYAKSQQR